MGKLTDWKEIINKRIRKYTSLAPFFFRLLRVGLGEVFFASSNLGLVRNRDGLWDILPQSFSVKTKSLVSAG